MKHIVTLLMALTVPLMIGSKEKDNIYHKSHLPRILIGTKWVYENKYQAERRTIEFISTDLVKFTIEDTNIWISKHMIAIKSGDNMDDENLIGKIVNENKATLYREG